MKMRAARRKRADACGDSCDAARLHAAHRGGRLHPRGCDRLARELGLCAVAARSAAGLGPSRR
eukprot:6198590-Pleurochrysis_carterae.AAC.1